MGRAWSSKASWSRGLLYEVSIPENTLGVFTGWEHVLTQKHDGVILMMTVFDEQIH